MVQIAALVNRDPTRVEDWMREFDIPRRMRGISGVGKVRQPSLKKPGWKMPETQRQAIREARQRDGRIPAYINGVHWLKTVPKEQHPNWKGGITPERQQFYASEEWRDAVKSVWQRDNATCQRCGLDSRPIPAKERRFHTHHIDSFSIRERRAVLENLVLLCQECHKWIHSKDNTAHEYIGNGFKSNNR